MEQDHLNAHNLFNLKGVKDGCVPLTKYFAVDIQVRGKLVHDIGVLVKADTLAWTDSKGKTTRAQAILGCNLIHKGIEEFIRNSVKHVLNFLRVLQEWTHCILARYVFTSTPNVKG